MPGIDRLLKSNSSNKAKCKICDFAETFWHFDIITKRSERSFITAYNAWAKKKGYRPSESKAKEIYALAKNGTPTLLSSMPSTKMLILESIRLLNTTNLTLRTILSQMHLLASPEYSVVSAMKGVGSQLSVLLIAEIGDVRRFHSSSALVAYAGLDAPPFQSCTFDGTKRHICGRITNKLQPFDASSAIKGLSFHFSISIPFWNLNTIVFSIACSTTALKIFAFSQGLSRETMHCLS